MFLPSSYSIRLGVNIMILSIVSNHDLRDLSFFKYIAGLMLYLHFHYRAKETLAATGADSSCGVRIDNVTLCSSQSTEIPPKFAWAVQTCEASPPQIFFLLETMLEYIDAGRQLPHDLPPKVSSGTV
eukprot:451708-Ditylum_brightwellii.AAC.1